MLCPNCGTENTDTANFCNNCAHNLKDVSPPVQEERFTKYIPKALMTKLQESAKLGGIENERRVVTILFCDIVGSTSHAENLDPEEWTEIISSTFDHIIPPIYKYEGILARLMGDAMLAFFGAPISHEDDPERAILAGIDILAAAREYSSIVKEKWGFDIDVRVGINTGLVVVGEIGSDMRVEYTAMGDAINVASRMETTAEPGSIQVTENTYNHISYLFDVEKIGNIKVKGKIEPIPTYKIIKKKPIVDKSKKYTEGDSAFVERDQELNQLHSLLDDVVSGTGKISWISGEAGIGKSRLIAEFHTSLSIKDRVHDAFQQYDPDSEKIYWFETGAMPYQISTPYGPIINFFLKYFGITLEMTNDKKYELVRTSLQKLPDGDDIFPFIANLLQIELSNNDIYQTAFLDPEILQETTFQSIITFLDTVSQDQPTILVFDDIQWADNSSLNFMEELIGHLKSNQIFLLILSRELPDHSDELYKKINRILKNDFQLIELSQLTENGTFSLISSILNVEDLPESVRDSIVTKSQGNPFYVEQLVKSFIESEYLVKENGKWVLTTEVSKLNIPDTLSNLLMTRLDQLDEKAKRVAQSASVIGREFLFPILQCINDTNVALDESIHTLEDREWITEEYIEADKIYRFKHVLNRDIAYNSLLIKRRKEIHGKIAHCLRQVDESLTDEIGRHLFEAGAFEDALPFIIKAAETAVRTNSTSEAISMLSQVEKLSDQVSDFNTLMSIYVALGTAYTMEGKFDESNEYYSTLLDHSKEKEDRRGEVRALNKLAENALYATQDISKADDYLEQAEEIGNLINFSEGLVENSAVRCVMHQSMGEFDKAAEYEIKGQNLSESMKDDFALISFRYNLIVSHVLSLKFQEAEDLIIKFIHDYEAAREQYFVSSVYGFLYAGILLIKGEITEAIKMAQKGLQMAEGIKAPFPIYLASRALGEIYLQTGELNKAEQHFEMSINASTKNTIFGLLASSKISLALTKIILGIEDQELINDGFKFMEMKNGTYWGGRTWGDLGYYYLYRKNFVDARKYFDLAITKPNASSAIYRPYNLIGKTRVCLEENSFEEATELLTKAREYCDQYGVKHYNAEITFLFGLIEYHQNQPIKAIDYLNEAYQLAKEFGFKQLLLEIISYTVKTHQSLNNDTKSDDLHQELTSLVNQQSSQFATDD
ncbi:MAG: adenylate/guanylate cyclase domain-containing protein, partial [Candidatus Kariarchaeaceae archaeon]